MITALIGKVIDNSITSVDLRVRDVVYEVKVSVMTSNELEKIGHSVGLDNVFFHIHHLIREDSQTLYGFLDKEERFIFRKLISVSGVGPSTAMHIISKYPPQLIKQMINSGDISGLTKVRGVGKKVAQKLILDLSGNISTTAIAVDFPFVGNQLIANHPLYNQNTRDAIDGLVVLGWNKKDAEKVVVEFVKNNPDALPAKIISACL